MHGRPINQCRADITRLDIAAASPWARDGLPGLFLPPFLPRLPLYRECIRPGVKIYIKVEPSLADNAARNSAKRREKKKTPKIKDDYFTEWERERERERSAFDFYAVCKIWLDLVSSLFRLILNKDARARNSVSYAVEHFSTFLFYKEERILPLLNAVNCMIYNKPCKLPRAAAEDRNEIASSRVTTRSL